MSLLNLSQAFLSFGTTPILDKTDFVVEKTERICLVGRNGAGKSTLLKVLSGEVMLDDGQLQYQSGLVIARLEQDPPRHINSTIFDFVAEGIADIAELLKKHHRLTQQLSSEHNEDLLNELDRVQSELEHVNGWQFEQRILDTLTQLSLSPDQKLSDLSGGWQRRASLAKALVRNPDILLLDEPTNHLDVDAISWLEEFLFNFSGSIVFISHDRSFIHKMATRIVDLDRGQLVSYPGDYQTYLQQKEEALRVETLQNELFDKKLAQEEIWIRQGIKARRTRNEGRVRALKALREQRRQRVDSLGTANITIDQSERSGKIIFEVESLNYKVGNNTLIKDFSATIMRGDKIALVGPNGIGKTTLIRLLLQEILPTSGNVKSGAKLEIAYFDQHRMDLDPEKSVMDNVADGKQDVEVNGRKRHVLGYLQDFLFPPQRAMSPVKALSGGEKNRLLLAKLLLKPNNLLILDEPTNDLDVETLELLEDILINYQGTLLIVSHDRQFIDNVATECYFFEGNGVLNKYVGGYTDAKQQQQNYLITKKARQPEHIESNKEQSLSSNEMKVKSSTRKPKLSYKEQRELEELPTQLEQLEEEINSLQLEVSSANFFNNNHEYTNEKLQCLAEKEQLLEQLLIRWEELESKQ